MKITSLPIGSIRRHPHSRPINDASLASLSESIEVMGLINPIRVRGHADGGYEVVAGHHRLAACSLNGWQEIACIIVDEDDVRAEMAMIAENLHRAELPKLERDEQVARWIELSGQKPTEEDSFEDFYAAVSENEPDLQSAQSAPIESRREDGRGHRPEGGINEASRVLGIERTDAQRAVKVANLSDEAKTVAREIGLDDNRTALLDAAKHSTPAAQVKALQERKQGKNAGRVASVDPAPAEPVFEEIASALETLCRLRAEDFRRLCPSTKRPVMHQRMDHLIAVFEQVKGGVAE